MAEVKCSRCRERFYRHDRERMCPDCVAVYVDVTRDAVTDMRRSEAQRLLRGLKEIAGAEE